MEEGKLDPILIDGVFGSINRDIDYLKKNREYIQRMLNQIRQEKLDEFGISRVFILKERDLPTGLYLRFLDGEEKLYKGKEAEEWLERLTN